MFLALGGEAMGQQLDEAGADFHIIKKPFKDFYRSITSIDSTETYQSFHLASIFCSLNYITNAPDANEQLLRLRALMQL